MTPKIQIIKVLLEIKEKIIKLVSNSKFICILYKKAGKILILTEI